jgi:hypothetical protein
MDNSPLIKSNGDKITWHRIHHQIAAFSSGALAAGVVFVLLVFLNPMAGAFGAMVGFVGGYLWYLRGRNDTLWVSGGTLIKRCVYQVSGAHHRRRFVRQEHVDLGNIVTVAIVNSYRRGGKVSRVLSIGDSSGSCVGLPLRWPFVGSEHWGAIVMAGCVSAGLDLSDEVVGAFRTLGVRVPQKLPVTH